MSGYVWGHNSCSRPYLGEGSYSYYDGELRVVMPAKKGSCDNGLLRRKFPFKWKSCDFSVKIVK